MRIGTIFIWYNYPYLIHEPDKDLWGVYWGFTNNFSITHEALFHKLTSRDWFYETGGNRERSPHFTFKKEKYSFFIKDKSIIDFGFDLESVPLSEFEKNITNKKIDTLYQLTEIEIKNLYTLIIRSDCTYSYIIKCRIKDLLNNEGIFGLEKPKRKISKPY